MNEEYIDNVKHLIEQKDADKVKGLLIDLHPADIAELCNDLNAEEAKFVSVSYTHLTLPTSNHV